jgi:hypothetical protein
MAVERMGLRHRLLRLDRIVGRRLLHLRRREMEGVVDIIR